jgi:hypothetical protein
MNEEEILEEIEQEELNNISGAEREEYEEIMYGADPNDCY